MLASDHDFAAGEQLEFRQCLAITNAGRWVALASSRWREVYAAGPTDGYVPSCERSEFDSNLTWVHRTLTLLDQEPIVKMANELGPLPQSVVRLSEVLSDPDYEMRDVVGAIELDPSLAGRLLRLANSALYSGDAVSSINLAVTRLGTSTVRSLAVAASARPKLNIDLSAFGLTPATYWKHCVAVLSFAEELTIQTRRNFGGDFTTAALLHDFGKLLLAKHVTPAHLAQLRQLSGDSYPSTEHEMCVLGVNHAEVSSVVATSWKLSEELINAVKYHHEPTLNDTPMCHGLNLANQLAWRLESREDEFDRESVSRHASMDALKLKEDQLELILTKGSERFKETLEVFH